MHSSRPVLALLLLAAALVRPAHGQGIVADYSLAPAMPLGGDLRSAGVSLHAGRNWFGQVAVSRGAPGVQLHPLAGDMVNLAGGYRFGDGQALSLQLSVGRGAAQRLELAVNYDWPRYFVRFSYDPQRFSLTPQETLRVSAGVRF